MAMLANALFDAVHRSGSCRKGLRVLDIRWFSRCLGISQICGHGLGGSQVFGWIKGRERFQARIDAAGQLDSVSNVSLSVTVVIGV